MRRSVTPLLVLSVLLFDGADLGAQSVLDWPLLLEARPATLVGGSGAVLGNPAGPAQIGGRGEALVSDLETPDEMGLRALTVAGAVRFHPEWAVALGYRHVGLGDMLRTDGPPLGPDVPTFEVAEDVYALGISFRRGGLGFGVAGRLDTPADELGGDAAWAGTLGALYAPPTPFVSVRLGGAVEVDEDDPGFSAALELSPPRLLDEQLYLAAAYGTRADSPLGLEHTVVALARWRGFAELQAGALAQPGADEHDWVPVVAGLVHLGRYRLGIVREHLPNAFGAAMHYRLSVVF